MHEPEYPALLLPAYPSYPCSSFWPAMATVLNPHAPVFFPNADAAADELSIIYPPCRPLPPQTCLAFVPQRYDHSCISKGAIFFHPSLIYYHYPSPTVFPNFSYYIPPPKFSITTISEPETAEVSGALPRVGDELGGVEQRFHIEAKAMEEQSLRTVSSSRFSIRGFRGKYGCRQLIKRNSQLWVRKSSSSFDSAQEAAFPPPDDLRFCEGAKSTVMIKNIPNKISRKQLLDLLDQHCRVQNQKIKEEGSDTASSEFDFLYLPMDFISGNNLGYAFINFTSPEAAKRLYQDMHMMPWNSFGSRKICEITHAKIQGLEELVKHFRRSIFTCSSTEYLPVCFHPSRDGSRDSPEQLIGKLAQLSLS